MPVTLKALYLPALRGKFKDWVYYSCLIPFRDLAQRVSFAKELHKNEGLSDMLQRVLEDDRADKIAGYLRKQKDHFFNSLVVAVYGGEPRWFAAGRITSHSDLDLAKVSKDALESIGLISLSGKEKLFAIDGQHRLAGVRKAVKQTPSMGDEIQSVLLVAHRNTEIGQRRTRRLFTTLNKTARPVSKNEIIALDEDDVMAIVTRRLVEEHPDFKGKRIAYNEAANLAPTDIDNLTTIVNLYDILSLLFTKVSPLDGKTKTEDLKYYRPSDTQLNAYYDLAWAFFACLKQNFGSLNEYFKSATPSRIVKRYRGDFGGSVMFRPIGLVLMTEVIASLAKTRSMPDAVKMASGLPQTLSEPPYENVLWDKRRGMGNQRKALVRDLLLYMLGELPKNKDEDAGKRYAKALELKPSQWEEALQRLPEVEVG